MLWRIIRFWLDFFLEKGLIGLFLISGHVLQGDIQKNKRYNTAMVGSGLQRKRG